MRHLRSHYQSTNSFRCFSCPTYFGSLASLNDHRELNHFKLPFTSVSFNNVCDLIHFSTEAVNSKFQIHRLKLEGCGVLVPFNYLVSQNKSIICFVDYLLKSMPNLQIKTVCCNNVRVSSYIETPALLKPLKRSLLNVVNKRHFLLLVLYSGSPDLFYGQAFLSQQPQKTSISCVSTRSSCQCLCPLFPHSKNVIIVPLMSINWRIPS